MKGKGKMMKKVFNRVTALALVTILAAGIFAGCQKATVKPEEEGVPDSTVTPVVQQELKQTEPVKIYTRTLNNMETKPDNEKVLKVIEEKSGIKIQKYYVAQDGYSDKMNMMLASGEEFDVMDVLAYSEHWSVMKERKHIQPLNDLIDQYGPNIKRVMAEAFKTTSDNNGIIWAIPRQEDFPTGYVPSIRKDWVDALGMSMPTTLSELEAYFEAVLTKDPNKNGKNDEIPLASVGLDTLIQDFQAYFTGFYGQRYLDSNGKVMKDWTHPGYKQMLEKFREWYQKGYIYKEFLIAKTNQVEDLITADRVGVFAGWYSNQVRPLVELQKINPQAAYDPVPVLQDSKMGVAAWGSNPKYSPRCVIPATSKNAAFAIKYIDWTLASMDNYTLAAIGIEGEHFNWVDKANNLLEVTGADKYSGNWLVTSFNSKELRAVKLISPEDKVGLEYDRLQKILKGDDFKYVEAFDHFVPYVTKGTAAENLTNDADTMMEEAKEKFILGLISGDEWDKAVEKYMELKGNILSEIWTQQYKEFTNQ